MPFPYTGCLTCKQRHLKCDGTFPTCTRCAKSKRPCLGAKDTTETLLFIHSENKYASGKRKRPRGPRAASPAVPMLLRPSISTSLSPVQGLARTAIEHFIRTTLKPGFEVPSLLRSVEEDILSIYNSRQSDPTIHLAISVLALAIYGRTQAQPQALTQACISYQQLLHETLFVLSSTPYPSHVEIETALFVTFCMSRYEDAVHIPGSNSKPKLHTSASHHDGSLALIKTIRDRQEGKPLRTLPSIVKHTRRCMIKSALLRNRGLPEWIHNGEDFGETGPELEYDHILVQLVELRHELQLLKLGISTHERIATSVEKAFELGKAFGRWSSDLPATWGFGHDDAQIKPPLSSEEHPTGYVALCLRCHATDILILSTFISFAIIRSTKDPLKQVTSIHQATTRLNTSINAFRTALGLLTLEKSKPAVGATLSNVTPRVLRWACWPLTMISLADEVKGADRLAIDSLMKETGKVSGFAVFEDV